MNILENEARIFTKYLVNDDVSAHAVKLYVSAMEPSKPNATDKKLLDFMVSHPHLIGLVDAGLVFHNSTSEARLRLYIMLAILEASPEYCNLFLPKRRGPFYVIVIAYSGIRAVIKSVLGLLLVKAVV